MPRGALCLLDVFIPIFADDWNQLSAVAIAYFPLSGWWMWSHLSDCAGFPVSSDIEGLSICAMDRAHQKGWIKPCRKAITNTPLLLWLFMTQRFQCMQFRGTQILFVNECLVNMNSLYQVIQPVYRFNYIVHIGCKYWREITVVTIDRCWYWQSIASKYTPSVTALIHVLKHACILLLSS